MTLRHLSIFIEVYKTLNMTTAAKNLYMAQPSVSQAIKELEKFYDTPLFERLSQKLYVTESGQRLYAYAHQILSLYETSIDQITHAPLTEKLRVGGNYTMGIHMLGDLTKNFKTTHPHVTIYTVINKTTYIQDLLRSNGLDIALVEEAPTAPDMIQHPFFDDRIVAVVAPEHPLAHHGPLVLEDIIHEAFLTREKGVGARDLFENNFIAKGYPFHPIWESISATSLINQCKAGAGIAILPYEAVKVPLAAGTLCELTLKDINLSRKLVIMYHKHKTLSKTLTQFIAACFDFTGVTPPQ